MKPVQFPAGDQPLQPDEYSGVLAEEMSERRLQALVEERLRLERFLVHHSPDSRGSEPGLLDITAVRAPRVLFIELKSQRGRLDTRMRLTRKDRVLPTQREWYLALQSCPGVETYLWRPQDWLDGTIERTLRPDDQRL